MTQTGLAVLAVQVAPPFRCPWPCPWHLSVDSEEDPLAAPTSLVPFSATSRSSDSLSSHPGVAFQHLL